MEKQNNLITGLWKFKDSVSLSDLESFAEELAKDEKFKQVYIRKASKDQNGLGIAYLSDIDLDENNFDKFMDEMKDKLYRKFGSGLVGWDFANSTTTFKGF